MRRVKEAAKLLREHESVRRCDVFNDNINWWYYESLSGYIGEKYFDVYFRIYQGVEEIDLSESITVCLPEVKEILKNYSDLFTIKN